MIRIAAILIAGVIALSLSQPTHASGVSDCDRLAAHGSDPDKVVAVGVSGKEISTEAISACQDAVADEPDNLRFRYQLARALAENGRASEGHPDMFMAAEGGYRQAQFVLGYLYDEGFQGLAQDPCEAEALWLGAARQGLMAALLSYPHHVMTGRFESCGIAVDKEELRAMLQRAQGMEPGYYQRMIVKDLLADIDGAESD